MGAGLWLQDVDKSQALGPAVPSYLCWCFPVAPQTPPLSCGYCPAPPRPLDYPLEGTLGWDMPFSLLAQLKVSLGTGPFFPPGTRCTSFPDPAQNSI